jgi:uncharacterized protein (DUF433 family)
MVTVLPIDVIVSDPKIRSGRPVITGTGICISDIVAYHIFDKQTPEELAASFKLPLGQVHAALAYYYMHKAEIDAEMKANAEDADKLLEELKRQGRLIIFNGSLKES